MLEIVSQGKHLLWLHRGKAILEVAKLLLEKGADVNAKDYINVSPLMLACERGSLELTRILLEKGADPNARGGKPTETTLSRAKNQEIVDLLRAAGGK
jgi:ankyrin repeat protein